MHFNGRDIIYLAATYPNVIIHYTRISFIKKMNEGIHDESLSRLANKTLLLLILSYIGFILCPLTHTFPLPSQREITILRHAFPHEKTFGETEIRWREEGRGE